MGGCCVVVLVSVDVCCVVEVGLGVVNDGVEEPEHVILAALAQEPAGVPPALQQISLFTHPTNGIPGPQHPALQLLLHFICPFIQEQPFVGT